MAHVGEHDWRGFRPDGPSAADLFDPAKLEARLVEARVRRAKALAARTEGKVVAPNPTSPLPLGRRGDRSLGGLLFLGGLALGSVGAVVATQAILGSAVPQPVVVALAGAPSWQGSPVPLAEASVLQHGLDPPSPSLPVLAVVAPEPDPKLPMPLAWVGAVPSKVRGAWTVRGTPPSQRLFAVQRQASVVRATHFTLRLPWAALRGSGCSVRHWAATPIRACRPWDRSLMSRASRGPIAHGNRADPAHSLNLRSRRQQNRRQPRPSHHPWQFRSRRRSRPQSPRPQPPQNHLLPLSSRISPKEAV